jgi:hypothetical protein
MTMDGDVAKGNEEREMSSDPVLPVAEFAWRARRVWEIARAKLDHIITIHAMWTPALESNVF